MNVGSTPIIVGITHYIDSPPTFVSDALERAEYRHGIYKNLDQYLDSYKVLSAVELESSEQNVVFGENCDYAALGGEVHSHTHRNAKTNFGKVERCYSTALKKRISSLATLAKKKRASHIVHVNVLWFSEWGREKSGEERHQGLYVIYNINIFTLKGGILKNLGSKAERLNFLPYPRYLQNISSELASDLAHELKPRIVGRRQQEK